MADEDKISDLDLSAIHQRVSSERAPAELDAKILAAATATLANASDQAAPQATRWEPTKWALAATVVVGVSVAWRVVEQTPAIQETRSELIELEQPQSQLDLRSVESMDRSQTAPLAADQTSPNGTDQALVEAARQAASVEAEARDAATAATASVTRVPESAFAESARGVETSADLSAAPEEVTARKRAPERPDEQSIVVTGARRAAVDNGNLGALAPAVNEVAVTPAKTEQLIDLETELGASSPCPDAGVELRLWRLCIARLDTNKDLVDAKLARQYFVELFPTESVPERAND